MHQPIIKSLTKQREKKNEKKKKSSLNAITCRKKPYFEVSRNVRIKDSIQSWFFVLPKERQNFIQSVILPLKARLIFNHSIQSMVVRNVSFSKQLHP